MLKRNIFIGFFCLLVLSAYSPQYSKPEINTSLTLLFAGDIMGHMPQVEAAYDSATNSYNFDTTFAFIKPVFKLYDFVIANLETTLTGEPYSGYPQFSSPDGLALSCRNAGITCLVTANNHCCDKGKNGLDRTICVLDSFRIPHTGTFRDSLEKSRRSPLILEKNGIRIALVNYTFSTNGIPVPSPFIVNMTDTAVIASDIKKAASMKVDKVIVFMHWGNEYQKIPDENQKSLAEFCFAKGADIIIGSHPHVIQPMVWYKDSTDLNEKVVVYSLGNFVSNQRKPGTDGGLMAGITLLKQGNTTAVTDVKYIPTWVYTPVLKQHRRYFILPVSEFENDTAFFQNKELYRAYLSFTDSTRAFLGKNNINISEYKPAVRTAGE